MTNFHMKPFNLALLLATDYLSKLNGFFVFCSGPICIVPGRLKFCGGKCFCDIVIHLLTHLQIARLYCECVKPKCKQELFDNSLVYRYSLIGLILYLS